MDSVICFTIPKDSMKQMLFIQEQVVLNDMMWAK